MFLVLDKAGDWVASHDWFDYALRYAKQYAGPGSRVERSEDGVVLARILKSGSSAKPIFNLQLLGGGVLES